MNTLLRFAGFCALSVVGAAFNLAAADAPKKIIFISGKPSHGPMAHEHRAGNMILAKRLNAAGLHVNAVVLPKDGYPEDPAVLNDAATIVVFCTGHRGHVLNPHLEEFDALMKKGTGVVMIHWATEAEVGMPAKKFLEWMGGFCDLNWSVNPHWSPKFKPVQHEIWNGAESFSLNDEWYYHMRFVEGMKGVTPILTDLPGIETLKRPDGERSGNPEVRRAVAAGESQPVAWAYERPDGQGRGFGFTGAHNHVSWQDDSFRKIMLNAILWTAHVAVPKGGVPSTKPDEQEIKANLDAKGEKAPAAKPKADKPAAANAASGAAVVDFQKLREQNFRRIDSQLSLDLLSRALAVSKEPAAQAAMLRGTLEGLAGRRNVKAPNGWKATATTLAASGDAEVRQMSQQLSLIFGDESAKAHALAILTDPSTPTEERREHLQSLVTMKHPQLKQTLTTLLKDANLRVDAIRAYGSLDDPSVSELLLKAYPEFDVTSKRTVLETLCSRKSYATQLLPAIQNGTVPKSEVPAYIARTLASLLGDSFTAVFGDMAALSKDKAELIAKYKNFVTPARMATANATRGRVIFQAVCASCHVLYGEGGHIGPDLTGSNRADLDYILLNMIDPSADVPDAYKLVTITARDGRLFTGTLAEEDDQRVVLNMIGQKSTVLKSDIAKREVSPLSMMPEGMLTAIPADQGLDLLKYLQTTKQVEPSK
ncbi:MAG: ThuA domain-containing protein [Prosthecobacter sp.]|uniref:ThuA domain-containing protein n=1 Tax=Prosthecobacter sp. TaxID=1965333 RepID=UPI0039038D8D